MYKGGATNGKFLKIEMLDKMNLFELQEVKQNYIDKYLQQVSKYPLECIEWNIKQLKLITEIEEHILSKFGNSND